MILLDPGHGGKDPGAMGGGIIESEYTLELCRMIQSELVCVEDGPECQMTREGDLSLSLRDRADIAHNAGADIVLSVHVNAAATRSLHGGMAFYWPTNHMGRLVADRITLALPPTLEGPFSGGVPADGDDWKKRVRNVLGVYNPTAVLVEVGYLTNEHDSHELKSPIIKEHLAAACVIGLLSWYRAFDGPRASL